MLSIIILLNIL